VGQGTLAGAIAADQRLYLPCLHQQVNAGENSVAIDLQGEVVGFEQGHGSS